MWPSDKRRKKKNEEKKEEREEEEEEEETRSPAIYEGRQASIAARALPYSDGFDIIIGVTGSD